MAIGNLHIWSVLGVYGRQPAEMTLAVLMRPFAVGWEERAPGDRQKVGGEDGEGFEPPVQLPVRRISSALLS